MGNKECLTRYGAIKWCVENLSSWPRLSFMSSPPSPIGWKWFYNSKMGLNLQRADYKMICESDYNIEVGAISEPESNESLAQKKVMEELRRELEKAEKFISSLARMSALEDCKMIPSKCHAGPMFVNSFYKGQEIITASLLEYEIKPIGDDE